MTGRGPLNGKTAASASSPRIDRHGRDGAGKASAPAQPDLAGISRYRDSLSAQWSREQQLSAAQRQIDDLLKLNALLEAERALLSESLSKAHRFACHDPLTGLPNRRLLADHFEQATAQAVRKHNYVVLLFLDLDGFKDINDSIGHTAADRLLQQVGSRLSSCLRASDTACRYGGDEFVVLLPDIDRPDQAFSVCGKIRSQLALPYVLDGTEIRATASLGTATFPTDGTDCFELIRSADLAMYRDKGGKRGRAPAQAKGNGSSADPDDIGDPVTPPGSPFATL